ncbi:hypothetical protein [Microbispora sp. H11081]|uniref:hypothetical protein n=1 Tax=Microbispora sp. H11081 TaxID=2729107 RepID=UPI00289970B5|nr:hypothetical protein [Microbispora sp. H11081]
MIVIGAQAIYLHTVRSPVALAETTKDSDLALDPRVLEDEPLLEQSMGRAGFYRDPLGGQPGAWLNSEGIPVDLMVPEALAGSGTKNTRGARIPPHDRRAARRARGLEAAVIDNMVMEVTALDPHDHRSYRVKVAGPAALLVAKLHKIFERVAVPHRLNDKDAHDIYRILIDTDTLQLAAAFDALLGDPISSETTDQAVEYLAALFASSPDALGARMAGRAEEGIGEPETVALATSLLAADLVRAMRPD